jgi:hypothetical protein
MGNNQSGCNECNCASEVPRVIAACNKAGSTAMSSSLDQAITGLVGKENSAIIMNEFNNSLGKNDCPNNKWCSDYQNILSTFANREGFIEGNEESIMETFSSSSMKTILKLILFFS